MNSSNTTSDKPSSEQADLSVSKSARFVTSLIGAYQKLSSGRPSPCRFYPSCSNYAVEAIHIHGTWRGVVLAVRRVGRCRPLGPHGVDLVPEAKTARSCKP